MVAERLASPTLDLGSGFRPCCPVVSLDRKMYSIFCLLTQAGGDPVTDGCLRLVRPYFIPFFKVLTVSLILFSFLLLHSTCHSFH